MRARLAGLAGLLIPVLLVGFLSIPNLAAQDKGQKSDKAGPKKENIQGIIQNISKDTSTITVRVGSGTVTRQVVYSPSTKWMVGHSDDNKPGALAQVKVTNYISCVGTFDAKTQLMAEQCVYRDAK